MSSDSTQLTDKSKYFERNQEHPTTPRGLIIRTPNVAWWPFVFIGLVLALAAAIALNYARTSPLLLVSGGIIGLIVVVIVMQRPEVGTYLIIFTVFTNLSDLFTEKGLPSINKPLVAIILLGIFANLILKTGKLSPLPKFTRVEGLLAAYFLVVVASYFVAQNQDRALEYVLDLAKDIAVGICVYITLNTKEKWKSGINVLLFAVAFVSVLGVIHTLTGSSQTFWGFAQQSAFGQTSDSGELRYGGPIAESNIWGQVLVSILPIALYRFSRARSTQSKFLTASASLFILLAMLFTQSRGAFLALVLVLIFIAIDLKIKSSTLLAAASIGLLLLVLVPSKYTERFRNLDTLFQSSDEGVAQDESVEGRREKMLTGLAMFADRPFLGVGFANYSDNYWSYAGSLGLESSTRNVNAETTERQPHSLYIEIMAETGLFGIATFLGFLGLLLSGLYQTRNKINENQKNPDPDWPAWISSLMMSIFTFLVAGFFLHGIGFRFIWVLSGLALSAIHLAPTPHYSIKHR
jgi:putative inorganic carbon (HCO3(-)) transporter